MHGGALPPLTVASGWNQSFVEVSVSVSAQRISLFLSELVATADERDNCLFNNILCNKERVLYTVFRVVTIPSRWKLTKKVTVPSVEISKQ